MQNKYNPISSKLCFKYRKQPYSLLAFFLSPKKNLSSLVFPNLNPNPKIILIILDTVKALFHNEPYNEDTLKTAWQFQEQHHYVFLQR